MPSSLSWIFLSTAFLNLPNAHNVVFNKGALHHSWVLPANERYLPFEDWTAAAECWDQTTFTHKPKVHQKWKDFYVSHFYGRAFAPARWRKFVLYDVILRTWAFSFNPPMPPSINYLDLWLAVDDEIETEKANGIYPIVTGNDWKSSAADYKYDPRAVLQSFQSGTSNSISSSHTQNFAHSFCSVQQPSPFVPAFKTKNISPPSGSKAMEQRPSENSAQPATSDRWCFTCGDTTHGPSKCGSQFQVTGAPVIVQRITNGHWVFIDGGESFCYAFNGKNGCKWGSNCRNGAHVCCRCKNGSHGAVECHA